MGCVRRALGSVVAKDDPMEGVADCRYEVEGGLCKYFVEEWCDERPWTCRDGA